MNCGNCGAQISANDVFCPNCGSHVQQQQSPVINSFCSNCGTEILSSDAFCPNCGKAIKGNGPGVYTEPSYDVKEPKKSNSGLIILIVITILAVAFAAVAVTYFVYNVSDNDSDERIEETQRSDKDNDENKPERKGKSTPRPTSAPEPPEFTGVEASSTRGYDVDESNNKTVYYYPSYAVDGDMSTAWTPNRNIDSYEPYITLTADEEQYVTGVRMTNGYCKSERTYTKNKRITKARISYNGGSKEVTFDLDNYGNMIEIEFDNPVHTDYVTVTVLETVDGGWHDVAISEIEPY